MRRLRHPGGAPAQPAEEAPADALVRMVGVGKPRAKRRPSPTRVREEVIAMLGSGDFSKARPMHLVALYEWLHLQVYGVRAAELEVASTWHAASFAASRLVEQQFRGDVEAAIEFVRWTWTRERERAKTRKEGQQVFRVGWRLQFVTGYILTDFRMATVGR